MPIFTSKKGISSSVGPTGVVYLEKLKSEEGEEVTR